MRNGHAWKDLQMKDWIMRVMRSAKRPVRNADLYAMIKVQAREHKHKLSANWRATVRNTLQRHAKGNPKCTTKPLFIHKAKGLWELKP